MNFRHFFCYLIFVTAFILSTQIFADKDVGSEKVLHRQFFI